MSAQCPHYILLRFSALFSASTLRLILRQSQLLNLADKPGVCIFSSMTNSLTQTIAVLPEHGGDVNGSRGEPLELPLMALHLRPSLALYHSLPAPYQVQDVPQKLCFFQSFSNV